MRWEKFVDDKVVVDGQIIGVWMIGPVRPPGARRPAYIPAEAWTALPIGLPAEAATVGAMSRMFGASVLIGRLHQKTPGTRRGSTQWSPDQLLVLSE